MTVTYQCQTRRLRVTLLMHVVICFHPDATKGNSVTVLSEPFGKFQSPGYPDLDDDMHCTWNVTVPPNHKIILNFLDFELEKRPICTDKVEIYEGDVKKGTYRGMQLHQQNVTSTSNTISVVLISCSTSLLFDRRGIHVSYSTVYPTTLAQETSIKVTSIIRIIPSTKTIGVPSEDSGNVDPVILAGLFASIFILIIITIVMVKRKAKLPSNASTASNENNEASCEQAELSTVVAEGIAQEISPLEYDYVQGTREPNVSYEHVVLDQNRVVFSTNMSFPKLQKKQPVFDTKNDACVCENNASNVYDNTNFDKDYGTVGCTFQETSPEVGNNDRHPQRKDVNSDEGIVVNSAYEPYIPQK